MLLQIMMEQRQQAAGEMRCSGLKMGGDILRSSRSKNIGIQAK